MGVFALETNIIPLRVFWVDLMSLYAQIIRRPAESLLFSKHSHTIRVIGTTRVRQRPVASLANRITSFVERISSISCDRRN